MEAVRRLDGYLQEPAMPFRLAQATGLRSTLDGPAETHRGSPTVGRARWPCPISHLRALGQQLLATNNSPSEQLTKRELARRVQAALAQLPEVDRELMLMRNFEGLSNLEVAKILADRARDS